ncbi:MAG: hypothetical protein ACRYGF_14690 [Janthinobacterium lividum]
MGPNTTPMNAVMFNLLLLFLLKSLCFLLGYLTVRLGYGLIRDGAKGDFTFKADLAGFKADLASVSPGLLFVLLGIGLIGYAMAVNKVVDYRAAGPATVTANPPDSPLP